ncbi:MAG: TetR/AcrR family transcriptional regulator [Thermodesulfobacteriota bacterium]
MARTKKKNPPATRRIRDREATRKRLIDAVGVLLARRGFPALGVNVVAREAGVDKVLIYRYFGGLPGLIRAFGREGDFWPGAEEIMGRPPRDFLALKPVDRFLALAKGYARAIRRRPLTLEIMAWEMVERNELTMELENIREEAMGRLLAAIAPAEESNLDIEAISALFGAAINYLAARARHITVFSGVENLDGPEGWARLEKSMERIVRSLFILGA